MVTAHSHHAKGKQICTTLNVIVIVAPILTCIFLSTSNCRSENGSERGKRSQRTKVDYRGREEAEEKRLRKWNSEQGNKSWRGAGLEVEGRRDKASFKWLYRSFTGVT